MRTLRLAAAALLLAAAPLAAQSSVTTPEKFFGFQMGTDRKMARWDRMVDYYTQLARESPRLKVVNLGPTSMGNPFLAVFISSPANLARLEEYRAMNLKLTDPRGVPTAELERIVRDGKAVVLQSMSMHANEIGGSQMAPELIFDLVSRTDEEARRILDNTIAIMVPSFNPDGQIMVTDWYMKYVGTEYEGSGYPSLYQKYVGHDNNRDAFMANMTESQYMARLLFREWKPEAYVDHHHMGSYGARIFLPPYAEPVRPSADPLVWRELSWYGGHMAYKEEEAGLSGVINMAIYSGWGHMGFHWITPFHNIAGMLTESASARLASPLYIHPDQLRGSTRGLPDYEEQTTFPNPWPGGWWRLRDIVERQKVSAWAVLDLAARNRETVLRNAWQKAARQTERGARGEVKAYLIAGDQHDRLTVIKLVNKLLGQGVEVQRSGTGFTHEGRVYPAGSFVVSMAQPKMGVVRWLLGRTFYPQNSYTREADGTPIRPYDMSTDTMDEFMGVRADPVGTPVRAPLTVVSAVLAPAGTVSKGSRGYLLDGRLNDAFRAVNLLLDKGVAVRRVDSAGAAYRPGDFTVDAGAPAALVAEVARVTGVDFAALDADPGPVSHPLQRLRIGLYNRYGGGNIDQGWTQFTLEQWNFPFSELRDVEVKAGNLEQKFDVIILPADNVNTLVGAAPGGAPGAVPGLGGGGFGGGTPPPPEFRSALGAEGVAALRSFVQKGGTLVTFGEAGSFAIERLGVPVRNVLQGLGSKEFWSPGSTFRVRVDNRNPLAYGMPDSAYATFLAGSQAYEFTPGDRSERVESVVTYEDRDILRSGQLDGEKYLARKSAMAVARVGEGRVVLIGFRAQHRSQTHGTFKLVFNALVR